MRCLVGNEKIFECMCASLPVSLSRSLPPALPGSALPGSSFLLFSPSISFVFSLSAHPGSVYLLLSLSLSRVSLFESLPLCRSLSFPPSLFLFTVSVFPGLLARLLALYFSEIHLSRLCSRSTRCLSLSPSLTHTHTHFNTVISGFSVFACSPLAISRPLTAKFGQRS